MFVACFMIVFSIKKNLFIKFLFFFFCFFLFFQILPHKKNKIFFIFFLKKGHDDEDEEEYHGLSQGDTSHIIVWQVHCSSSPAF